MRTNAFTLIEMVLVILIVSVIASLALVAYNDVMSQQVERRMITDLKAIDAAIRIRESRLGPYDTCGAGCATAQLNADLGLKLTPLAHVTYRCFWTGVTENRCRGEYSEGPTYWEVTLWPASVGDNPYCSSGTCPTCTAAGCDYL